MNALSKFWSKVALCVATWFGSGLLPKAPGTWGSIAALPLIWVLAPYSPEIRLSFWLILLVFATFCTHTYSRSIQQSDPSSVVVDEVLGMGITTFWIPMTAPWLLAGFILFRIFDIIKIPPVRQVDLWSKKQTGFFPAFGVIADDLIAGFQAAFVLWAASYWIT